MTLGAKAIGLCLCLALGAFAFERSTRPTQLHQETLYVFGTLVEVVIEGVSEAEAAAATKQVGELFQRLHKDWHAWRPGELEELNAAIAKGDSFEASPELAKLLTQGQALAALSEGRFDPGIGGLIELWGFHDDVPPEGAPPSETEIAKLLRQSPSIASLIIDGTTIRSDNPATQLDLGGFAKGAALDLAAIKLTELGIENAVLNAGGDVNVLGRKAERPWRIAIRNPFDWGAVAALDVGPGETVYTSGNYERYLEQDGVRLSHILDPHTGRPVIGIVSATVLDTEGTRADAAATALSVAGPEHWREVARAMGIELALIIDDRGHIQMTPAMARRVILTDKEAQIDVAVLN